VNGPTKRVINIFEGPMKISANLGAEQVLKSSFCSAKSKSKTKILQLKYFLV
jgi:hypothetical protein